MEGFTYIPLDSAEDFLREQRGEATVNEAVLDVAAQSLSKVATEIDGDWVIPWNDAIAAVEDDGFVLADVRRITGQELYLLPELFTIKRTFYVYDGMSVPQYDEIEVTITNDSSTILDGEFVETSWFSGHQCKILTECTDEVPTDGQIEAWLCKSECADSVSSTPWDDHRGDTEGRVKNYYGDWVSFEQAIHIADRDLCEELHNKLAPCTDQEFFDAYCEAHEAKYGEDFIPYVNGAW